MSRPAPTRAPPGRAGDPLARLAALLARARRADPRSYNAMTLATVDPNGAPSARIVLLKQVDARGVVFFTNYASRKGRALAAQPRAALVFWWTALRRQVRIEGRVARVPRAESEAYFATRPRAYRLGAWASPQSAAIRGPADLARRYHAAALRFRGRAVPCPPHWGGFRLLPTRIEFWTERPSRLHDREEYRPARGGGWTRRRLAP